MTFRVWAGMTAVAVACAAVGVGCSATVTDSPGDLFPDASAPGDGGGQKDTGAANDSGLALDGGNQADASDAADGAPIDATTPPPKDGGTDAGDAATILDASLDSALDSGVDAAPDASADAGPKDTGAPSDASADSNADADDPDADAALTCEPADESTFVPTWHPPAKPQSACDQTQIDAYHQCLIDGQTGPTPASCDRFTGTAATTADKACLACIVVQDTAPAYGPVIVHRGTIEINVPGCLALATNDPLGQGCSGKLQASNECTNAACAANCPIVDDASFEAEQVCESSARSGGCATWDSAATCADALVDAGGPSAACVSGQSFDDLFDAVVPLFCGAAATDSGAPARASGHPRSARALPKR